MKIRTLCATASGGLLLLALLLSAISYQLDRTLLDGAYIQSELDRAHLDLPKIATEQIVKMMPAEYAKYAPVVSSTIMAAPVAASTRWVDPAEVLRAQLATAVDATHGYLTGRRRRLEFALNFDEVKKRFRQNLSDELQRDPPAEWKDLSAAERVPLIGQILDQLDHEIQLPGTITLETLGEQPRRQLMFLREIIDEFRVVRNVAYVASGILLGLTWIFGSMRLTGMFLLVGGALVHGLHALARWSSVSLNLIDLSGLPGSLGSQLPGAIQRMVEPIGVVGTMLLILGAGMVAGAVFLKKKPHVAAVSTGEPAPVAHPSSPLVAGNKRRPLLAAAGAFAVLVVLAIWPGDVINRYRAEALEDQARYAEGSEEWPKALGLFRQAAQTRAADRGREELFQAKQARWLRFLDEKITRLTPEERYVFFNTAPLPATRALLTEPLASGHRAFIEANLEMVRYNMRDKFLQAHDLVEAGDDIAAQKLIEGMKPMAGAFDGFAHAVEMHERQILAGKLMAAAESANAGDFAGARAALTALKGTPRLPAEDLADAAFRIDLLEYRTALDVIGKTLLDGDLANGEKLIGAAELQAENLAKQDGYNRFFRDIPMADRIPQVKLALDAMRILMRKQAAKSYTADISELVQAGSPELVQAKLNEYAERRGSRFAATGVALVREQDFERFLAMTRELEMDGDPDVSPNRVDVALVAAVRNRFRDQSPVRAFLAEGYLDWSRRCDNGGRDQAALYLLDQAAAAGGTVNDKERSALLANIAKLAEFTVYLTPTVTGKQESFSAKETDHSADLLDEAETQAGIEKVIVVARAAIRKTLEKGTKGWIKVKEEVAPIDLPGAVVVLKTHATGITHEEGIPWKFSWDISYDDGRPAELCNPIHYPRNHAARFDAVVQFAGQPVGSAAWNANLRYAALEVRGNISYMNWYPAAATPQYLAPDKIARQLARNLSAEISAQGSLLLHRVAEASFTCLQAEYAEAGAERQAELAWGNVALWAAAGLRVADYGQRENALRQSLGLSALPVAVSVPAKNLPAAGRPFENSLGMKFVQVTGLDSLFSIWETRVQDYAAFITETGYIQPAGSNIINAEAGWHWSDVADWKNPGFGQKPDHPVVCITAHSAKAFCEWLTQKERATSLIGMDQEYRLPNDLEWSAAVGLGKERGSTPEERAKQVSGFPWGNQWPPPPGAGNLAGYDVNDTHWPMILLAIPDYDDGFARTSPVGSFSPNPMGLYDLEGNVGEWCTGAFNNTGDFIRGAAFSDTAEIALVSSARWSVNLPQYNLGFRVILAPVAQVP
jgi:hypothetical protein